MNSWIPLSQRPTTELRTMAKAYRGMAETARMADIMASLRKLADRLDNVASRKQETCGDS